jgi:ribosomal protein L15E
MPQERVQRGAQREFLLRGGRSRAMAEGSISVSVPHSIAARAVQRAARRRPIVVSIQLALDPNQRRGRRTEKIVPES